jgi:hypothetical protein
LNRRCCYFVQTSVVFHRKLNENIDATIYSVVISLRHYALPQMRVA